MAGHFPVLQIATAASNVPFEIHTMQWIAQARRQQIALPHRHNYFTIVWVKKGSGTHLIDLQEYAIAADTIYCITPGQVHLLKADAGTDGYVISFTTDFFQSDNHFDLLFDSGLFYSCSAPPVLEAAPDMRDDLEDVAQKMIKEFENFFLLRSEILRGYLKIFLIYLTRRYTQAKPDVHHSKNISLVKNFFDLLEKHFTTKRMVADYAAELALTPNYLNEVVKKISGFPASEHIKQRVALEAKRHAAYSGLNMKEIAYKLGFDDIAHFSKYFKAATGANFTEFKKNTLLQADSVAR